MANNPKLLGIYGSLRKEAYTKAVLETVKDEVADRATIEIFPLHDIPLYNSDLEETGVPDAVTRFKNAIQEADGLVIVSPEYNYGVTGVLKNAIDWASRPGYNSVLKGKPVVVMSSSMAFTGGVRAHEQLRHALSGILARVIAIPEIVIGEVHNKVNNGRLTDAISLKYAVGGVDYLLEEIALLKKR